MSLSAYLLSSDLSYTSGTFKKVELHLPVNLNSVPASIHQEANETALSTEGSPLTSAPSFMQHCGRGG